MEKDSQTPGAPTGGNPATFGANGNRPCRVTDEPLIRVLKLLIRVSVRILAVLMTAVILWGVADVVYVLYQRLISPPFLLLKISDILATFGAFMAVLIAIEIFINIVMYLRDDVIHVRIVIATALMAISRKVIILDFSETAPEYVFGLAAVVFSLSITYWLVVIKDPRPNPAEHDQI